MFDSIIAATIKRTIDTRINNKISLIYILDSFHSSPTVLSLLIAALTSFISNFVKSMLHLMRVLMIRIQIFHEAILRQYKK